MLSALVSSVPTPANRKQPMVVGSDQNKKDEQGNDHYFL